MVSGRTSRWWSVHIVLHRAPAELLPARLLSDLKLIIFQNKGNDPFITFPALLFFFLRDLSGGCSLLSDNWLVLLQPSAKLKWLDIFASPNRGSQYKPPHSPQTKQKVWNSWWPFINERQQSHNIYQIKVSWNKVYAACGVNRKVSFSLNTYLPWHTQQVCQWMKTTSRAAEFCHVNISFSHLSTAHTAKSFQIVDFCRVFFNFKLCW